MRILGSAEMPNAHSATDAVVVAMLLTAVGWAAAARSPSTVQVRDVAYVPEILGVPLAGLKELHPVSDHAPIIFSAVALTLEQVS